uniref:Disease resistance R13L4/SHOC-2-like LRR domain-containing protein n=2 Tax=Odontella aurita TaxID=265563 RepID=A0A7S4HXS2_9STRA|mmetsp:Transcript_16840/g.48551  ORF Transcript_16840/g.48551 Transcript_16840/m.48551 type:complete len:621 (+) Transcript_16840:439-2301(+)
MEEGKVNVSGDEGDDASQWRAFPATKQSSSGGGARGASVVIDAIRGSRRALDRVLSNLSGKDDGDEGGGRSYNGMASDDGDVGRKGLSNRALLSDAAVEAMEEGEVVRPHKGFLCFPCKWCNRKVFVCSIIAAYCLGGLIVGLVFFSRERMANGGSNEPELSKGGRIPGAGVVDVNVNATKGTKEFNITGTIFVGTPPLPSPKPSRVLSSAPTGAPAPPTPPTSGLSISRPEVPTGATERVARIADLVAAVSGEATYDKATPQGKAFDWMTSVDETILPPEDALVVQRYIFVLLYYSLDGDRWNSEGVEEKEAGQGRRYLDGTSSECDWDDGIRCVRGWARHLNLTDAGLRGRIPTELVKLRTLVKLNFASNSITGPIPHSIGRLDRLSLLDLSSNRISGDIPTSLGNMTQLSHLDLRGNVRLRGGIPHTVGRLTKLTTMSLDGNSLQGRIPPLKDLTRLKVLELQGNKLTGRIPASVGRLTDIQYLRLSNNFLTGPMPKRLGELSKLKELHLYNNRLSSSIPSDLGKMRSLEFLSLFDNSLTGKVPPSLGKLKGLKSCALDSNKLTGSMPDAVCALTKEREGSDGEGGGALEFLSADCGGRNPEVTCGCCSVCHATSLA